MKKFVIILMLCFSGLSYSLATVRTVSNDPAKPAQYSSLQIAHDQAVAGDTILVSGSATTYGTIYIRKQLVIIGNGYNRPAGDVSIIDALYLGQAAQSGNPSGSRISGFQVVTIYYGYLNCGVSRFENIVVERCQVTSAIYVDYSDVNNTAVVYLNDTVRNCLFTNAGAITYFNFYQADYQNFVVHNNFFENTYIQSSIVTLNMQNIKFKNNVHLNRAVNTYLNTSFLVIENSIFYKAEPQGCTNCAFNFNITYGNSNNTIPGSGNVGTGNQVGINPQFSNFPIAGAPFSYTYDFSLKSTSPGKNAGTDGSDIGIMGGILPFEVGKNPPIPQMTELTIPANNTSVKQGGTLNVTFKASKQ